MPEKIMCYCVWPVGSIELRRSSKLQPKHSEARLDGLPWDPSHGRTRLEAG